jgi:CitMHS family citrate-Mg2+:H+ or citrate-Ca2+:H+ symporter
VLAGLGFAAMAVFTALVMSKRVSPLVGLILVPLLFGIAAGGGGLGEWMLQGIRQVAPIAVALLFAILFFGLMIDAGLFEPLIGWITRAARGDPLRVLVGTALLALLVSLDGDGSTTYMVTVSAMLPLYRRLQLRPLHLTCLAMLASGVMNLTPWGGPAARAASALGVDLQELFVPMLPALGAAAAAVLGVAVYLGLRERRRCESLAPAPAAPAQAAHPPGGAPRRPLLLALNAALVAALLLALGVGLLPLPALFALAFALALALNHPGAEAQRQQLARHAQSALAVVAVILAAGVFTGVLTRACSRCCRRRSARTWP